MDFAFILLLILINGVFAMCEIAVVSSRTARLQSLAEDGSAGARAAIALHTEPGEFLSTVQVGITSVGILSGLLGESVLADPLTAWLGGFPAVADHARSIATTIVVVGLTYLSVVVGELVPKRIGLLAPERTAAIVARPMHVLATLAHPLVRLLSRSSEVLLRLIGVHREYAHPVTNEEIHALMGQGAESGIFHQSEQELVSNVLRLDEQRVTSIMTYRGNMFTVDLDAPVEELRRRLTECRFERVVAYRGEPENVVGVLRLADLVGDELCGSALDVESKVAPPFYVPDCLTTVQLIENFRRVRKSFALVVDEYGQVEGLVTLTDVLRSIVGGALRPEGHDGKEGSARSAGERLLDGSLPIERFKDMFGTDAELPGEAESGFNTLGGFLMYMLQRVPVESDRVEWNGLGFEVLSTHRNRVDKVRVTGVPGSSQPPGPEDR